MIRKIINEIKQFKGMNRLVFLLSIVNDLPRIIKNRSLLGMDFITRIVIKDYKGDEKIIRTYAELCYHTYDYSNIINRVKGETLFLDIGAHFGEVTHRFLNEKQGYAYMFEVNPNNCKIIKKLSKKNGHTARSKLFEFGLGDNEYNDTLLLKNPFSYEGSLKDTTGTIKHKVKVKPLTIDMLDRYDRYYKNIFVSLDVEGYEYKVLQGMGSFLKKVNDDKKHIDLFIEIKDKETLQDITNYLKHRLNRLRVKKITTEDYLFSN